MKTTYSKSSEDIQLEMGRILLEDENKRISQRNTAQFLNNEKSRNKCILCNHALRGSEEILHRGVKYCFCQNCNHLQTKAPPPQDYPHGPRYGQTFEKIYPALKEQEYLSRVERIYSPKLDWLLNDSELDLKSKNWIELGSGAGSFAKALSLEGVKNYHGIERDSKLIEISKLMNPDYNFIHHTKSLEEVFDSHSADIYVAFFVFEHVDDPYNLFKRISSLPTGTMLYFSVPTFGMSAILESAFENHWARNLDSVLHLQLYTDESIYKALEIADMAPLKQWVFGQDCNDLTRCILKSLKSNWGNKIFSKLEKNLLQIQDGFQSVLDKAHLSDSRHILAIKK